MSFSVQAVDWQRAEPQLRHIRETVFVHEQGVAAEEEWDGMDGECQHFLAYENAGALADGSELVAVGCARLRELELDSSAIFNKSSVPHRESEASSTNPTPLRVAKLERMAVLAGWRGKGCGAVILREIICQCIGSFDKVVLNAQVHAQGFYQSCGFVAEGERFLEAGIEHVKMTLNLHDRAQLEKGLRDEVMRFKGGSGRDAHLALLVDGLAGELRLQFQQLPRVFSNKEFCDRLRRKLVDQPKLQIKILIADSANLRQQHPAFCQLVSRLSSRLSVRDLTVDAEHLEQDFACGDRSALLFVNDRAVDSGFARMNCRAEVASFRELFERNWAYQSRENIELRTLYL